MKFLKLFEGFRIQDKVSILNNVFGCWLMTKIFNAEKSNLILSSFEKTKGDDYHVHDSIKRYKDVKNQHVVTIIEYPRYVRVSIKQSLRNKCRKEFFRIIKMEKKDWEIATLYRVAIERVFGIHNKTTQYDLF